MRALSNVFALMLYCARVWRLLPCRRRQKQQILCKVRARALAWLEQNPSLPFAEFEKLFGSPQAIAASYLEQMDASEVLSKLTIRKKILLTIAAAAAVALLIWAAGVITAVSDFNKGTRGSVTVYPAVEEEDSYVGEGTLATDENGEGVLPE